MGGYFARVSSNRIMLNSLSQGKTFARLVPAAQTIALAHHERWDGTGYPCGLKGEDIPLEARIVSVVDVDDALGSKRPCKQPLLEDEWQQIIRAGAGRVFDPEVVKAFFKSSKPSSP